MLDDLAREREAGAARGLRHLCYATDWSCPGWFDIHVGYADDLDQAPYYARSPSDDEPAAA